MKFTPHDYQRRAIEWVKERPRCALFLEMGLGKSVITLTAIRQLLDDFAISRVLVVAPKKVAESTWGAEASKWEHLSGLRVDVMTGNAIERRRAYEAPGVVKVIGRDLFAALWASEGAKWPFDCIIIDELTSFKSSTSKRFKAMKKASAVTSRVIGLTGTPSPNGLADLWAQMMVIDQGKRLGRYKGPFLDKYFVQVRWNNIPIRLTLKDGAADEIQAKIADICLSMSASDYLKMPGLMVHDFRVELPRAVRDRYEEFERDQVMEFAAARDTAGGLVTADSAAALMNKLLQFANGAVYDSEGDAHEVHGEKLAALREVVDSADGAVLVFYQYRSDLPRICELLQDNYRVRIYSGARDLEDWNAGKIDVLLAHPASTAYGLNMQQGGHTIAWFGLGWNLELYQQANARLYRQGQTRPVIVHRLLCAGTVDERVAVALEGKGGAQRALMDGIKSLTTKYRI